MSGWRQFTPEHLEHENCMARTWQHGRGGQCTRKALDGEYCKIHATEDQRCHGSVLGPIPPTKFVLFLQARLEECTHERDQLLKERDQTTAALKRMRRAVDHQAEDLEREVKLQKRSREAMMCERGVKEFWHWGFLCGNGGQDVHIPEAVLPSYVIPFSILRARLENDLLQYLQGSPEWSQPLSEWKLMRKTADKDMGFERHAEGAVEEYRHCFSETSPGNNVDCALFGRSVTLPAPQRIMAFRHAFNCINSRKLNTMGHSLQIALRDPKVTPEEKKQFGHDGGDSLALSRAAFAYATIQIDFDSRPHPNMNRHVDGGPSLLHMSLALQGGRKVICETVPTSQQDNQEVIKHTISLRPGDVYVSSPACFYHSVEYEHEALEDSGNRSAAAAPLPRLLALHLRSDLLRLRSKPQFFHQSNRLLSETIAPVVSAALTKDPFNMPTLQDVLEAETMLGFGSVGEVALRGHGAASAQPPEMNEPVPLISRTQWKCSPSSGIPKVSRGIPKLR